MLRERCVDLPFLSFNMGVDGGQLSRRAQCGCTPTVEPASRQRCLAVSGSVVSLLPVLSLNMGVDGGQLSRRSRCGCTLSAI